MATKNCANLRPLPRSSPPCSVSSEGCRWKDTTPNEQHSSPTDTDTRRGIRSQSSFSTTPSISEAENDRAAQCHECDAENQDGGKSQARIHHAPRVLAAALETAHFENPCFSPNTDRDCGVLSPQFSSADVDIHTTAMVTGHGDGNSNGTTKGARSNIVHEGDSDDSWSSSEASASPRDSQVVFGDPKYDWVGSALYGSDDDCHAYDKEPAGEEGRARHRSRAAAVKRLPIASIARPRQIITVRAPMLQTLSSTDADIVKKNAMHSKSESRRRRRSTQSVAHGQEPPCLLKDTGKSPVSCETGGVILSPLAAPVRCSDRELSRGVPPYYIPGSHQRRHQGHYKPKAYLKEDSSHTLHRKDRRNSTLPAIEKTLGEAGGDLWVSRESCSRNETARRYNQATRLGEDHTCTVSDAKGTNRC